MTRSGVRRTDRARGGAPLDAPDDGGDRDGATATAVAAAPDAPPVHGATDDGSGPSARAWAAVDPRRWSTRVVAAVIVVLTAGMLLVSYAGKDRCVGQGSVIAADGHIIVRGQNGKVVLVEANPAKYTEKGRFQASDLRGRSSRSRSNNA